MFKNKVLEEVIVTDVNGNDHILNWDYIEEFVIPIVKEHPINNAIIEMNKDYKFGELMVSRSNGKWGISIKTYFMDTKFYPLYQMNEIDINDNLDNVFNDVNKILTDRVDHGNQIRDIENFGKFIVFYLKFRRDQKITQILK